MADLNAFFHGQALRLYGIFRQPLVDHALDGVAGVFIQILDGVGRHGVFVACRKEFFQLQAFEDFLIDDLPGRDVRLHVVVEAQHADDRAFVASDKIRR